MANNKEPIAKKCRSLDISPAVMGYGNKKSTRNPGGNKRKKVSEYGISSKRSRRSSLFTVCWRSSSTVTTSRRPT